MVRLLDLSACGEYVDHASMYRAGRILDAAQQPRLSNPTRERFSPSSVVKRGNLLETRHSKEHIPAAASEPRLPRTRKTGADLEAQNRKVKSASSLGAPKIPSISGRARDSGPEVELHKLPDPPCLAGDRVPSTIFEQNEHQASSEEIGEESPGWKVGVGVYMRVDRLNPGQCFVSSTT